MKLTTTAAVLGASTGIAVAYATALVPPGLGAGDPLQLTALVLSNDAFWRTWLLAATSIVLAIMAAARRRRDGAAVAEPLLWGCALPIAALLVDPYSFARTSATLMLTGAGLGFLGTLHRARRTDGARAGRHVPARFLAATVAAAVLVPTFLALPVPPWFHPLSGDEPHYLVIARSLWVDGDLDLRNEYEQSLLTPFWPDELSAHAKPGADPDKRYSIHGSALGLWLAPWFGAGRNLPEAAFNVLARAAMSLWLAAAAVVLYQLIRDMSNADAAARGTLLAAFTLPLLFAGPHLFPAVPAFVLGAAAYAIVRRGPGVAGCLAAGVLLAGLPWLHFKFFGVLAAIAGFGIFVQWRAGSEPRRWPQIAALAAPVLSTIMAHVGFTWTLYGRVSPAAIHLGADPTLRGTAAGDDWLAYLTDPLGTLTTGIGYFLDQREGLLFYAPHYLLAVAGCAWLWRHRRRDAAAMGLVFAALVVPYAMSQEIGHWGPPARPLTGVLWTLAVPLAIGFTLPPGDGPRARMRATLRTVLVVWGVVATFVLLAQADLLYHEYSVRRSLVLLRYGAPGLPLADFAPLWLGPDAVRWLPSLAWLVPTLGAGAVFWRWGAAGDEPPTTPEMAPARDLATAAAVIAALAAVGLAHHARVPVSELHQSWGSGGVRYWRPQSPPTRAWSAPEGVWAGGNDSVELLLSTAEPLAAIAFEIETLAPMLAEVQVGVDRQTLQLEPDRRTFGRFAPGRPTPWNGEYFYHLNVVAHGGASLAALGRGDDGRGLGVLLEVVQLETAQGSPADR